jgi:hypothetical protein
LDEPDYLIISALDLEYSPSDKKYPQAGLVAARRPLSGVLSDLIAFCKTRKKYPQAGLVAARLPLSGVLSDLILLCKTRKKYPQAGL